MPTGNRFNTGAPHTVHEQAPTALSIEELKAKIDPAILAEVRSQYDGNTAVATDRLQNGVLFGLGDAADAGLRFVADSASGVVTSLVKGGTVSENIDWWRNRTHQVDMAKELIRLERPNAALTGDIAGVVVGLAVGATEVRGAVMGVTAAKDAVTTAAAKAVSTTVAEKTAPVIVNAVTEGTTDVAKVAEVAKTPEQLAAQARQAEQQAAQKARQEAIQPKKLQQPEATQHQLSQQQQAMGPQRGGTSPPQGSGTPLSPLAQQRADLINAGFKPDAVDKALLAAHLAAPAAAPSTFAGLLHAALPKSIVGRTLATIGTALGIGAAGLAAYKIGPGGVWGYTTNVGPELTKVDNDLAAGNVGDLLADRHKPLAQTSRPRGMPEPGK